MLLFLRPIIDLSVASNALPSHYFLHHQPPAGQREIVCELAASVARVEVIDQMPALYEFSAHFMVKRVKKKAFGATAGVVCGGGLYQQHPGQRVNIAAACMVVANGPRKSCERSLVPFTLSVFTPAPLLCDVVWPSVCINNDRSRIELCVF
jgi:hypothetical protein